MRKTLIFTDAQICALLRKWLFGGPNDGVFRRSIYRRIRISMYFVIGLNICIFEFIKIDLWPLQIRDSLLRF